VPVPALRGAAGEDSVPGRPRPLRAAVHRAGVAALAAGVRAALLRQPVQAVVPAGRAQGRVGKSVAARRLADAERRLRGSGGGVAGPAGAGGGGGGGREPAITVPYAGAPPPPAR